MENESNQKVATIIINYNNSEVTINCINSIKDTESNKYTHIFIGDNSTNIEEYKRLNNYIKNNQEVKEFVNLIRIDHNEGFGSANNYVINNIDLTDYEYIFLLNNDTLIISKDTFKNLIERYREDNEKKIIGCQLLNKDNTLQVSGGYFPTLINDFLYQMHLNEIFKKSRFDYVSGADIFFKKDLIHEVGFFDEKYFLYFEETDLQYRAQKKGYKIVFFSKEHIIHLGRSNNWK